MHKRFAVASMTFLTLATTTSAYGEQVVRASGFQEFSITSQKTGKTMSSSAIEPLVCQSTTAHMTTFMDLTKNFDLLGTTGDTTGSLTMFAGMQNGRRVNITFWVNKAANNKLSAVLVGNEPVLKCSP